MGRAMAGATKHLIEGDANLNIAFRNPPKGMSAAASVVGLFKAVNISRGSSIRWAQG